MKGEEKNTLRKHFTNIFAFVKNIKEPTFIIIQPREYLTGNSQ